MLALISLALTIVTQALIEAATFRWYLAEYHPHVDRPWARVLVAVGASLALVLVAVVTMVVGAAVGAEGLLLLVTGGVLLGVKCAVLKTTLRSSPWGAFGILAMSFAVGAVAGVVGLLHPLLPLVLAAGAVALRARKDLSVQQLQSAADAL